MKFSYLLCLLFFTTASLLTGCVSPSVEQMYEDEHSHEFLMKDDPEETSVHEGIFTDIQRSLENSPRPLTLRLTPIVDYQMSQCSSNRGNAFCFNLESDKYKLEANFSSGLSGEYIFSLNNKEIFRHRMHYGSDGPARSLQVINGEPILTFVTSKDTYESFYKGEFLANNFGVDGVSNVFFYAQKMGFVVWDNNQASVWYDGRRVSREFDQILGYTCCAMPHLFSFDPENGVVEFLAKRKDAYYIVVVRLKSSL